MHVTFWFHSLFKIRTEYLLGVNLVVVWKVEHIKDQALTQVHDAKIGPEGTIFASCMSVEAWPCVKLEWVFSLLTHAPMGFHMLTHAPMRFHLLTHALMEFHLLMHAPLPFALSMHSEQCTCLVCRHINAFDSAEAKSQSAWRRSWQLQLVSKFSPGALHFPFLLTINSFQATGPRH
jgi:hypothetical protein